VEQFTSENSAVTKSGATITYGPFYDIEPVTPRFIREYQQRIEVHYGYELPVLEVITLKRAAEISHWGANLNIQNEIQLHNAGPE
jgi:oligosaccharyltransferase complex subunit alpha (ribophorin I)